MRWRRQESMPRGSLCLELHSSEGLAAVRWLVKISLRSTLSECDKGIAVLMNDYLSSVARPTAKREGRGGGVKGGGEVIISNGNDKKYEIMSTLENLY